MGIGGIQNSSNIMASSVSLLRAAYYAPEDTNQDGLVSAAEKRAYALKHPEVEAGKRLRTASSAQASPMASDSPLDRYTQKGALNAWGKTSSRLLDLYV